MLVVGTAMVDAPAEEVWAALHDPAVLRRAVPGCANFEVTGPGLVEFTAAPGLPAVAGVYSGRLSVAAQPEPGIIAVTATASGERGGATADLVVRIASADGAGTMVSYEAEGVATGALAGVGTRLLAGAAKRLVAEFFSAVNEVIAEHRAREAADAAAAPVRSAPAAELSRTAVPADAKVPLLAGAAIGLAGVIVGVLLGRRNRVHRPARPLSGNRG